MVLVSITFHFGSETVSISKQRPIMIYLSPVLRLSNLQSLSSLCLWLETIRYSFVMFIRLLQENWIFDVFYSFTFPFYKAFTKDWILVVLCTFTLPFYKAPTKELNCCCFLYLYFPIFEVSGKKSYVPSPHDCSGNNPQHDCTGNNSIFNFGLFK